MSSQRWEATYARWLVREVDRRAGTELGHLPLLSVSEYRGVVPRRGDGVGQQASEDITTYKVCLQDDIVLNRLWAFRGGIGRSPVDGLVSPDYAVLRPVPGNHPAFLHYLFRSSRFVGEMSARLRGIGTTTTSAGRKPRLNVLDFGTIPVHLPSLEEQRRIADYLDVELARMDRLSAVNERAAKLAWEHFRRLRREVVCQGRALGSAETSRSLASLPGWRVAPLWMVALNFDAVRVPLNAEERGARPGPYPYWGANSVQDQIDGFLYDGEHVLIAEDGGPFFVEERDAAWVVDGKFWVNNHAHVLKGVDVPNAWLSACLNCVDFSLFVGGSTRDKLTQTDMNAIPIPVAPGGYTCDALRRIAGASERARSLDQVAKATQELLGERKQALITAAVTGELTV